MDNKIRYLVLISSLAILFGSILVIMFFVNRKPPSEPQEPTVTPTPIQIPSPIISLDPDVKQSITSKLPAITDGYQIEYLSTSDKFRITIKENPYKENLAKAEQWFKDQGVTDLKSINIIYDKFRWVTSE